VNTKEAIEYLMPIYESAHSAQYKEALGVAIEALTERGFYPVIVKRAIENAPRVEAVPRRIGRWTEDGSCSVCGAYDNRDPYGSAFCPDCGAIMERRKVYAMPIS